MEASSLSSSPIVSAYSALIRSNALVHDPIQFDVATKLAAISDQLAAVQVGRSGIAGFFRKRHQVPKGLYMWGGVGRGKTMLMDLFFDQVPIEQKRRVHFHEFMGEMHAEIAKFRAESKNHHANADPIAAIAKPVIGATRLLCFDEFHVTDITNAMLLGRLFSNFFAAGMVIVATSNSAPDELYKNGLNRQLILPFIAQLKNHCDVAALNGDRDYRSDMLTGQPVFVVADPAARRKSMDEIWTKLVGGQKTSAATIRVLGRDLAVPSQAMGAARFEFAQLCDNPLGAQDYLALGHHYHTVMIDDVPAFSRLNSNAAKRFILLIDTLYDRGTKLVASFAAPLDQLSSDPNTGFEFERCVSRLQEMQSQTYLSAARPDEPAFEN